MNEATRNIEYPRGRPHATAQRWLRPGLVPASWLYQGASALTRRLRDRGGAPSPDGVTVIAVGNIEAGGNGKTPLCHYLLDRLHTEGHPVAYVSRGYGSRSERYDGVTLMGDTPDAPGSGARWVDERQAGQAEEIGDEAAMIASRLPGVPMALSRRKSRAVEAVSPLVSGGFVVLDDAFQSWGVARDIDVLLLDATHPLGDGRMLPAGTLREKASALARADVILFNGASTDEEIQRSLDMCRRHVAEGTVVGGVRRSLELIEASTGAPAAAGAGVYAAVSSIARHGAFESGVADMGAPAAVALRYPDHHRYDPRDMGAIRRACDAFGCDTVVTTEKDWAKLRDHRLGGVRVILARLRLDLVGDWVFEQIKKPRA